MVSYVYAFIAFVLCVVTSQAFEGCTVRFGRRGCEHVILEGVLVTCDGFARERDIPVNVPQDAVYLSLTNFKLDKLTKQDFEAFASVECLSISNSGINKIDADAFSAMTGLKELSLDGANIDSSSLAFVNQESFNVQLLKVTNARRISALNLAPTKNLNEVKTLSFAGNAISHLNFEVFEQLKALESLDLSRNNLDKLDWRSLMAVETLNKLFLDNNRCVLLPKNPFTYIYLYICVPYSVEVLKYYVVR